MPKSARHQPGQESPLVERIPPAEPAVAPDAPGVVLSEPPRFGYVNLRGDADDAAFIDAVADELGIRLPVEPNTIAAGERCLALWLGPNEWFVRTEPEAAGETVAGLERALAGQSVAANDVSSGQATLMLTGPHARDVLEKGCTLDLHPRAFGPGQCAQTLLAKASVVLRPTEAGYEIIVRRSFADYLFVWLADAADEFGMAVMH